VRSGELGRKYRCSHPGRNIVDFVIAASAQLLDADLATANIRHYTMFAGLTLPYTH
jgi:hypothetical protein